MINSPIALGTEPEKPLKYLEMMRFINRDDAKIYRAILTSAGVSSIDQSHLAQYQQIVMQHIYNDADGINKTTISQQK